MAPFIDIFSDENIEADRVIELCNKFWEEIPLQEDMKPPKPYFRVMHDTKALGWFFIDKQRATRRAHTAKGAPTIEMSIYVLRSGEDDFKQIFLHECAHYFVCHYEGHRLSWTENHGMEFRSWVLRLGGSEQVTGAHTSIGTKVLREKLRERAEHKEKSPKEQKYERWKEERGF